MLLTGMAKQNVDVVAKAADFNEGWAGEITLYARLAGIDGDVTVNGTETHVDRSFSDLWDSMDLAGSLLGVVRKDRLVFWTQANYFGLDSNNLDDAPVNASLKTDTTLLEAAPFGRIVCIITLGPARSSHTSAVPFGSCNLRWRARELGCSIVMD